MTWLNGEILQNWEESSRREWLVTNGIGGYSSSSVSGANTRRYHGLLAPAFAPPLGRAVTLSKIEEEVRVEDELYLLSANKYPSVVQPQGYRHLHHFDSEPVPTFTYLFHEDSVSIEKRIWMPYGKNTVYIQYRLIKAPEKIRIGFVPLMAYKDYHSEQHRWDGFYGAVSKESDHRIKIVAFDGARPLYLCCDSVAQFTDHNGWFYNLEHPREQERGLDYTEDLYCVGRFDGIMSPGSVITLMATFDPELPEDPHTSLQQEIERQKTILSIAGVNPAEDPVQAALTLAADQFVIPNSDRVARATIIAGYHWFTDWGRDTMISLPGLCLTTRRYEIARDILTSFAKSTHNGLLPNRFSDSGAGADYNTVDASMWFFHAIQQYAEQSGDWDFAVTKMLPVLEDILSHHIKGTDYNIHVDPEDGLLNAGEHLVQLTWMDARVGDWVVTPRQGKPVEINALWYNALRVTALLYEMAGKPRKAKEYEKRAAQVKTSFLKKFWNPETHCLFDLIDLEGRPDPSIRPNQIFAVSLPFPCVDGDNAKSIVEQVEKVLLTPFGLRTLAPGSSNYHSHYGPGDGLQRDGAYHQGTVWPWLIGHFVSAHLKVYGDKQRSRELLKDLLDTAMNRYGIGTINEIFDAEPPYAPNGCIAQAWSVAEVLRAYVATK